MKQLTKNIQSEYSKKDLEAIMLNHDNRTQAIISDLDGTIHKGLCPSKLEGATFADLSILLSLHLAIGPKLLSHIMQNIRIFKDYKTSTMKGLPPSNIEKKLIIDYCQNILWGMQLQDVERALYGIADLAYSKSKECLAEMSKTSAEFTIITKSIEPVLLEYRGEFAFQGCYANFHCNTLEIQKGKIQGLKQPAMLTYEDKLNAAKKSLKDRERAVIFGNTDEDTAMFKAAEQLNVPCLKVAVHPRGNTIISSADVIVSSWRELYSEILRK